MSVAGLVPVATATIKTESAWAQWGGGVKTTPRSKGRRAVNIASVWEHMGEAKGVWKHWGWGSIPGRGLRIGTSMGEGAAGSELMDCMMSGDNSQVRFCKGRISPRLGRKENWYEMRRSSRCRRVKRGWRNSEEWAQRIILVVVFRFDWHGERWEGSRIQLKTGEYFES